MSYATIDDLRSQLGKEGPAVSAEYVAKMMHAVPVSETVARMEFILERVKGKRVLDFGASGALHAAIAKTAAFVAGVDREDGPGVFGFDLDDVDHVDLPTIDPKPDVIVCGEVLEHLSNPGWFLTRLKRQYAGVPVIISVPNAFSTVARQHIVKGTENVNRDHVAWYSHKTLSTLLKRAGYTVQESYWYNGQPYVAEGLIVVTE